MHVIDRVHLNAAGGYAEGKVLDSLEFLKKGWWGVEKPNGSFIHEKGPDKGHIGDKYGFLLLTSVATSKGFGGVDMEWSLGYYRFDMGIEFAVRVKGHSQSPSIQGVLSRGSKEFRVIWGWVLHCANCGVKRVMQEFRAEMAKSRLFAHSSIFDEWAVKASAIWSTLELEQEAVKLSV